MNTGKTLLPWFAAIILLCSLSFKAGASHIMGGELTYQCLGNNYYQVTLTLYRDNCATGSINMPLTLDFELVELPGTYVSTHQVYRGPSTYISPTSPGCGTPTPNVCVESAQYILDSLYLPPSSNGYMVYHQQCCRNTAVDNVVNAWQEGMTTPAYIYNTGACNNSPVFNGYPPVVVPTGVPLAMPVGATDPDADSLYHEFCTPFGSQNTTPPFSLVPWVAGYSSSYQVPSNPALSIDPSTGVVYGTISQNGKFSVGICVSEYRNGVMIGKTRRDYQFVSITPWTVFASIQSQTNASCGNGGSATAAAGGGQGPYSYQWSNGQSGTTATNLAVGTHSVIVTGSGGCKDTAFVTITGTGGGVSLNLASKTDAGCSGSNGSATVAASGGSAPYSYLWSDGSTAASNSNLSAGNHSVSVTDAGGCTATLNVIIAATSGPALQLNASQNESCPGAADASIDLNTTGGTAPFSYSWSNGASTEDLSNLTAGSYSVVVNDSNGCTDSLTINITAAAGFGIDSIYALDESCPGAANGEIELFVSSPTATYSWSDGASGALRTGLTAGNYSVVVTNAAGCGDSAQITITTGSPLQLTVDSIQDVSCYGSKDGHLAISAQGGVGPYTYQWNNITSLSARSNLAVGSYFIIVTDSRGCYSTDTFTISGPDSLQISMLSLQQPSCGANNDGSIALSLNGGTPPYSYSWNNGVQDTVLSNAGAANYTFNVTDANGCSSSRSFSLQAAAGISLSIDSTATASCGQANGFASLSISGGTAPFNYNWSNGVTAATNSSLPAGTAWVVVSDAAGCSDSLSFNVTNTAGLSVQLDSSAAASCGQANGFASLSISGGTAPFNYNWSNGVTTATNSSLPAGTAWVVVSDAAGCSDSLSFNVTNTAGLSVQLDSSAAASCGQANGFASLSISGGMAPFGYNWSNGVTTATNSSLPAGTAWVVVSDAAGCSDSLSFNVANTAGLSVQLDSSAAASCGQANGFASLSISGGTAPFGYNWSNGITVAANNSLSAGSAWVVVTDAAGCSDSLSFSVSNTAALTVQLDSTAPASCGQANGFVSLNISGGLAPFSFNWVNGGNGPINSNLAGGNAWVVVTDAQGCEDSLSFTVGKVIGLNAQLDSTAATTCGQSNGFVSLKLAGGSAPYTYNWSNGVAAAVNNSLPSGAAWVVVTGAAGCSDSISFNVGASTGLSVQLDSTAAASCGQANGFASLSISGGTAPFSYNWSNNTTAATNSGLPAGSAWVMVTDATGCSDSLSFSVGNTTGLSVQLDSLKNISCAGGNDGYLAVSASGGSAPYNYQWSNSSSLSVLNNLAAGTYGLTITDSQGCSVSASYSITAPDSLKLILANSNDVSCNGAADGSIVVQLSGGQKPYSYSWSNGQLDSLATGLSAGSHILQVTDKAGCSFSQSFTISQPAPITITLDSVSAASCGAHNGYAGVSASGGQAPYSFSWSNGAMGATADSLSAGSQWVIATDNKGCSDTLHLQISSAGNNALATIDSIAGVGCNGSSYARVSINAGVSNYSLIWSDGNTALVNTQLPAGVAYVIITNNVGCSDTLHFTIPAGNPLVINVSEAKNPNCAGEHSGAVAVSVSGGTAPYSFLWNNGAQSNRLDFIAAGNYSVTVTDASGCSDTQSVVLVEPDSFVVRIDSLIQPTACEEGAVYLSALNGDTIAAISAVKGKVGASMRSLTGLDGGNYNLMLTNTRGCVSWLQFELDQASPLQWSSFDISGDGCAQGDLFDVELTVSGGTQPLQYQWSDGVTTAFRRDLMPGTYQLTVTDSNGCQLDTSLVLATKSVEIESFLSEVACGSDADAMLSVTVQGATAPYSLWLDGKEVALGPIPVSQGYHDITVKDAEGCEFNEQVYVEARLGGKIYFANAFTPNGDGINDWYKISGDEMCYGHGRLEIYNRWGGLIFVSDDPLQQFWDGSVNGEPAQNGIYTYIFTVDGYQQRGTINLSR